MPLEAAVRFSDSGVRTAGISHTSGSSNIVITTAGDYKIIFSVTATEPSQFALFLNGARVAGTTYASPSGLQQNTGQAILTIGANATLTVRNHASAGAVTLPGAAPTVNASILIQKLN